MLINEKIEIIVNNHSVLHYLELNYDAKCGKKLIIYSKDLTKASMVKVNVKCDNCSKIQQIRFQDYNKILHKQERYFCKKCKTINIKRTKINEYGDANYNNREKYEITMIEKYDTTIPLRNDNIKKKKEKTCIEKYGFKNASENIEISEKIKSTLIKKYSDSNFLEKMKNNYVDVCNNKYGVDFYTQSLDYKEKNKKTCMEKYGVEHNGSVEKLILKRQETQNRDKTINYKELFKRYRNKITYQTSKNIKIFLEQWNGYDFYDDEYIADNFQLDSKDRDYPTIDHKISVYYGFNNNISVCDISKMENLCITKRYINSKKGKKSYKKK